LAITPPTDCCYLALFSAINMQINDVPQSMAGAETTKNLAKVIAEQYFFQLYWMFKLFANEIILYGMSIS
jgi:hypothetical protein